MSETDELPKIPEMILRSVRHTLCSLRYALCILFTAFLLSFPIKALIADYYYNRVSVILDNKSTDYLDVKEISAGTMSDYLAAIKSLEKAVNIHASVGNLAQLSSPFPKSKKPPKNPPPKPRHRSNRYLNCAAMLIQKGLFPWQAMTSLRTDHHGWGVANASALCLHQ